MAAVVVRSVRLLAPPHLRCGHTHAPCDWVRSGHRNPSVGVTTSECVRVAQSAHVPPRGHRTAASARKQPQTPSGLNGRFGGCAGLPRVGAGACGFSVPELLPARLLSGGPVHPSPAAHPRAMHPHGPWPPDRQPRQRWNAVRPHDRRAGSAGMPYIRGEASWVLLGPGVDLRSTAFRVSKSLARFRRRGLCGYQHGDESADAVTFARAALDGRGRPGATFRPRAMPRRRRHAHV